MIFGQIIAPPISQVQNVACPTGWKYNGTRCVGPAPKVVDTVHEMPTTAEFPSPMSPCPVLQIQDGAGGCMPMPADLFAQNMVQSAKAQGATDDQIDDALDSIENALRSGMQSSNPNMQAIVDQLRQIPQEIAETYICAVRKAVNSVLFGCIKKSWIYWGAGIAGGLILLSVMRRKAA